MTRRNLLPEGRGTWDKAFSQGWRVGNTVWVAGQVSVDSDGNVVGEGDLAVQASNVFANVTEVLADGAAMWKDVVHTNTYFVCEGSDDSVRECWKTIVEARAPYLADPPPGGTAVRVVGLAIPGLLVEVEAVAVLE
jgi:2-iminobutanoate/2-iminopropanoate deaminase